MFYHSKTDYNSSLGELSMRVVNAWNSLPVHVGNTRLVVCLAHIMFSPELPAHEQL